MQASGHIGKLVLVPDGNAGVRLRAAAAAQRCGPDGTYLVTGGLERVRLRGGALAGAARRRLARAARPARRRHAGRGRAGGRARSRRHRRPRLCRRCRRPRFARPRCWRKSARAQPPLRGVVHAASRDRRRARRRNRRRRMPRRSCGRSSAGAIALDAADPRRPDRAVPAVFLGDDAARRARPGRLCRGQHGARSAGAAAPRRGPAGAGSRLGPDRGCRLSRRPARDARRACPPPRRQADPGRRGPCRPSGAVASGLPVAAFAETSWSEARRFLPILATPLFRRDPRRGERLRLGRYADRAARRARRGRGAGPAQDRRRRGGGRHPAAPGRPASTRCGRSPRWAWIR